MNDLLTALDNGKICFLTLLDLSPAFNTIDHNILLHRLEHTFGISDSALSWFRSHLSDKIQTVAVNGLRADETPLPFGVPQGSVLGPVLCVLYTRPRFELIKKHSIQHRAFADDNQLYKETVPDQIQTTEIMKKCITDVKLWMTHNKLQLNDSKTESMLVKSHRLSVNLSLPSSMCIGNSEVLFVSSVKNLGVTLDCNLNVIQHVLNICRSAYIELRQIGSIRHLLTAQATQTLVCAFILSRLDKAVKSTQVPDLAHQKELVALV